MNSVAVEMLAMELFRRNYGIGLDPERYTQGWAEALAEAAALLEEREELDGEDVIEEERRDRYRL